MKKVRPPLANEPNHASMQNRTGARALAMALLLVAGTHLLAQLMAPAGLLADGTQILLMPLLAGTVLTVTNAPRSRIIRLVLIALCFSWVGDTLPRFMTGDLAFLAMVGGFLVAQFFYLAALASYWKSSILRRWWITLPYLAGFAVLLVLCSRGAGTLLVPVVIYGLALTAMAILSTGLGTVAGIGGAIFFLSDSLIALRSFTDIGLPEMGFWIMLTYVVGQGMIGYAAVRIEQQEKNTVQCKKPTRARSRCSWCTATG